MNETTKKEKLDLLNQTLSYLLVKSDEDELISESLSELEGDYYTFLNPYFSKVLKQEGLVSRKVESGINFLFEMINSIDQKLWNISSFQNDNQWLKVKNVAKIIQEFLKKEGDAHS